MKLQVSPFVICIMVLFFIYGKSYSFVDNYAPNLSQTIDYTYFTDTKSFIYPLFIKTLTYASIGIKNAKSTIQTSTYDNSQGKDKLNHFEEFSYKSNTILTFGKGILFGFLLTLLLVNLTSYILFNEKLFLYFTGVIATFTGVFWAFDGATIPSLTPQIDASEALALLLLTGSFMIFSCHFLNLKKYYPNLTFYNSIIIGIAFTLILLGYVFTNHTLIKVANTVLMGLMSIYFIAGCLFFSKKNYAKFYVIASAIPLLFMIDFMVLQPVNISFLNVSITHIEVATIFEILLFTYAIIFRMKTINEEIEVKKTEMKLFLKQQDALTRSNVEMLIEDVYLENLIMHYDLDGIEVKLLQYISEGKSNTKIARKLKLTEKEVKEYTQVLYEKLDINEKVQQDYNLVDSQPDYIYN